MAKEISNCNMTQSKTDANKKSEHYNTRVSVETTSLLEEGSLCNAKHNKNEGDCSVDMDAPLSAIETLKSYFVCIVIPWIIYFPLLFASGFLRTSPQQPGFNGLWLGPAMFSIAYMMSIGTLLDDPRIIRERIWMQNNGGVQKADEEPLKEMYAQKLYIIFFFCVLLVSGFDAAGQSSTIIRKSSFPFILHLIGAEQMILSHIFIVRLLHVNKFASEVVYAQEKHTIVNTGAYSVVRHPFDSYMILLCISIPLVIGSYWGLIPGIFVFVVSMWRTCYEEDSLVQMFGEEYKVYQQQVPSKMIPLIF